MNNIFFMKPVLQLTSQGNIFRQAFVWILRIIAGLLVIAALVGWVRLWIAIVELSGAGIVGGVIFQLALVVAVYTVVHTLLIRAGDIGKLPESEFTVLPIVAVFLRMIGEIYACFAVSIGVAGGIFIWFAGREAVGLIRQLRIPFISSSGGGLVGGLSMMIGSIIAGFLVLVLFYMTAEAVVVIVKIAQNTRRMADQVR